MPADHDAVEFDEQAITDILVGIDEVLESHGRERMDIIDGPTVDALRDVVKRELVAFLDAVRDARSDEEMIPLRDVLEALGRYGADPDLVAGVLRLKRRVRDARGDDELRAENKRLRELYANQANIKARGWTIDHLMECEEALLMAEQRVAELGEEVERYKRLVARYRKPIPDGGANWRERAQTAHIRACDAEAELERARSPQGEDHEETNDERRP